VKDDDQVLSQVLRSTFLTNPPKRLGVAVSGGSDSMALLHLLADWAGEGGPEVLAVTVDHGLRSGAAREATGVARTCAGLGIAHDIRRWQGWDHKGNLQDQARRARLRLIAEWASERGIDTVALGHTADDQAETFLMRLARGSGVDGLAAMDHWRRAHGINWVRPVLALRRWELRDYLYRRDIRWFDDPTNEDERYDRVKMRKALAMLEPLGISAKSLADTAARLQTARVALRHYACDRARQISRTEAGDVIFDRKGLLATLEEPRDRLLAHALRWVATAEYRPRQDSLAGLWRSITEGKSTVLHGCQILVDEEVVRITREYNAVQGVVAQPGEVWDARWLVSGPLTMGYEVRALGEAELTACPDWRQTALPRASLLGTPAIWQDDQLLAAPLAGMANDWSVRLACDDDDFITSLITH
jgi:tRNA(Ile)-lysidine synthase